MMKNSDNGVEIFDVCTRRVADEQRGERLVLKLMQQIFMEILAYHKLCVRWFPKILTEQQKEQRMSNGRRFLDRYRQDGNDLFFHIVMGHQTLLSYSNVE
ncbi:hypothetical protein Trydic_g11083 [Trypoxylus dichotomus]